MGAVDVVSASFETSGMDTAGLSDTALVSFVRTALESVKTGDSDHYTQIVGSMYLKEYSDTDAVAELEVLLKCLSGSVACLDVLIHRDLLSAIFRMSLWDHKPYVMDALVGLIISLAVTSGKYLDSCLNMLVGNFIPPAFVMRLLKARMDDKKKDVFSRVHEALQRICYLVPLAPSRLAPILSFKWPRVNANEILHMTYVDNLFMLEKSSIGKVVGGSILTSVMVRLRDLDLESEGDDILQDDSSKGMFDMELEDAVDDTMIEGEKLSVESQNQSVVLDNLMLNTFEHLEFCREAGRLDQVFEILFEAFENFVLNTFKSKYSQFVMFYACSLDPENCGVKFASKLLDIYLPRKNPLLMRQSAVAYLAGYLSRGKFLRASFVAIVLKRLVEECAEYCRTCNDDVDPKKHRAFYSGCQAIMYVLCFRMKSILDVPRFQSELAPLESILTHKLNPLMVCLPSVVSEFLKQAKACGLFIVSEAFIFDDLTESELSRAFGGVHRLDTFFPFDPYLLKISNGCISRNFNYWSNVISNYDEGDDDDELCPEVIVNGDADSNEEFDDDAKDLDNGMTNMSITPKHSFMRETDRLSKMPSRIRPSTSPAESL